MAARTVRGGHDDSLGWRFDDLELKVKAAAVCGHKFGIQIVGFKV